MFNKNYLRHFSTSLWVTFCLGFMSGGCRQNTNFNVETVSGITYFEGGLHDKLSKVSKTGDGGFIYCGYTGNDTSNADAYLMKVDAQGNQQWFKKYGGKYFDEFKHVIACSDGGYLAVGSTNSYGKGFNDKSFILTDFIVKTDGSGNVQWIKSYLNSTSRLEYATELPNHEYAAAGHYHSSSDGNRNMVVLKLGEQGNLLKSRLFPNFDSIPPANNRRSWNEYPNFITLAKDGSLLIGGTMDKSNYLVEVQSHVTFLMKVSADLPAQMDLFYSYADYARGLTYWSTIKPFRVPFVKVIEVNDGYYIGTYFEMPGSQMVVQLLKTDFKGVVLWEKKYQGMGNAMLYDFMINSDGSLMLTGMTTDKQMNFAYLEAFGSSKMLLLKLNPDGEKIFEKFYGGDLNTSMARRVFENNSGGWDLTGFTTETQTGLDKMLHCTVDAKGNLIYKQ